MASAALLRLALSFLHMQNPYTLFGKLTLDAGTWADWFSGIMSFAAVLVALGGYCWSHKLQNADRAERQRQAAKQIAVKLCRVMNCTDDIRRHVHAEYKGPKLEGVDAGQTWRKIHPLIGLTDEPGLQLDGSEQALLIDAKAHEFMMDLMLVISRYQSIIGSMKEYSVRYDALQSIMPAPQEWDGARARHQLSQEQLMRILPYSSALESIIVAIINMVDENIGKCRELVVQYHPIMVSHFGDDAFPKLSVPEEATSEAVASVNAK